MCGSHQPSQAVTFDLSIFQTGYGMNQHHTCSTNGYICSFTAWMLYRVVRCRQSTLNIQYIIHKVVYQSAIDLHIISQLVKETKVRYGICAGLKIWYTYILYSLYTYGFKGFSRKRTFFSMSYFQYPWLRPGRQHQGTEHWTMLVNGHNTPVATEMNSWQYPGTCLRVLVPSKDGLRLRGNINLPSTETNVPPSIWAHTRLSS